MAILSFSKTREQFIAGEKSVTRRSWARSHFEMWVRMWDSERLVHDAYDNIPRAGGRKIGKFRLTARPYMEKLADMPETDLMAEGGICASLEEFYELIGVSSDEYVAVVRFSRIE